MVRGEVADVSLDPFAAISPPSSTLRCGMPEPVRHRQVFGRLALSLARIKQPDTEYVLLYTATSISPARPATWISEAWQDDADQHQHRIYPRSWRRSSQISASRARSCARLVRAPFNLLLIAGGVDELFWHGLLAHRQRHGHLALPGATADVLIAHGSRKTGRARSPGSSSTAPRRHSRRRRRTIDVADTWYRRPACHGSIVKMQRAGTRHPEVSDRNDLLQPSPTRSRTSEQRRRSSCDDVVHTFASSRIVLMGPQHPACMNSKLVMASGDLVIAFIGGGGCGAGVRRSTTR